jgi:signal transduction histidine kinase
VQEYLNRPMSRSAAKSPTARLLAGLAVILSATAVYSGYAIAQLHGLERVQADILDRNRADSLLLLRIQNDLNLLGLAMRDMLDGSEPYPLTAWQSQFRRVRSDLEDALTRHLHSPAADAMSGQRAYIVASLDQFWDALDRVFALARNGNTAEARSLIRLSLQARQEALTTAVARLLVQNTETEQQAGELTRAVYARVGRNSYIFVAAVLVLILLTSLYVVSYNRRVFRELAALSVQRSELAKQVISAQEKILASISRELHDDFGQILTAIGGMLQRAERRLSQDPEGLRPDLREVQEIVQSTLDKVRSLSHSLHPVMLDEIGFESALDQYLLAFEKQTGIEIKYEKPGCGGRLDPALGIHVYRVIQEALNNVAKHSNGTRAEVRLRYLPEATVLEVQDNGSGFLSRGRQGLGLVSMRERADLLNGSLELDNAGTGGAVVRLTVPMPAEESHDGA